MYVKNLKITITFRVLLTLLCLSGIVLNIASWENGVWEILSYYTLQSNILVFIFFSYWVWRIWRARPKQPIVLSPTIKGAVTICVTLTFLVYHFMLAPTMFTMDNQYALSPANLLVHYITPLMVIADWLLFDKKGLLKKLDPLKWLLIPLAYFVFAVIRAQFTTFSFSDSRYPYFFMDFDKFGAGRVGIYILFITIGYVALGYLFYFADWFMSNIAKRKRR
jgi:hypothetical protein